MPTDTPKPDEFAGLTREMLITQINQLRDLVTMEQANLASAREEIKQRRDELRSLDMRLSVERAARERTSGSYAMLYSRWEQSEAALATAREQNRAKDEEIARLRGIIGAVSCNEATITDCERYCSHGEDKLHAEARAIRAALSEQGK